MGDDWYYYREGEGEREREDTFDIVLSTFCDSGVLTERRRRRHVGGQRYPRHLLSSLLPRNQLKIVGPKQLPYRWLFVSNFVMESSSI